MVNPEVSIIIINYNTFELTCNCIQSVFDKTRDVSIEVILVDNASTERDPGGFLLRFPEIVLVKSTKNLGFARGNNLGVGYAKSEIILLLNSDVVLKNNAVKLCYSRLIAEREVGVITCKLLYPDGDIQRQCKRFDTITLFLLEATRFHKLLSREKRAKVFLNGYHDHKTEIYPDRVWGTFFMFRKSILEYFPGKKLADRFFMYGEDNEWCYQLRKFTQFKILYFPEAEIIHFIGGSAFGGNRKDKKNEVINRNSFVCLSDYYGTIKTKILFMMKGTKF